jgi:hypothetical protein
MIMRSPLQYKILGLVAIVSVGCLTACTQPPVETSTKETSTKPSPSVVASTSPSTAPVITENPPTETQTKAVPAKTASTAVAASPVAKAENASTKESRRVTFAPGKTSTTLSGQVGKYGSIDYILGASKGQTMKAAVVSECDRVTLDLLYVDVDKLTAIPATTNEVKTNLSTTLTSAGDYIVRVQNSDLPSCKYSFSVSIK